MSNDDRDSRREGTVVALTPFLDDWPPLERLGRFAHLRDRLAALPASLGPIDFRVIRAVDLPTPDTWPASPGRPGPAPPRVEPAWLAGVLQNGPTQEPWPARLGHVARLLRGSPGWTLVSVWLLEVALAWPRGEECAGLLADLGDLYCQTGDIVEGVKLLDTAAERDAERGHEHRLLAARWIALLHPEVATERLSKIPSDAPDHVRLLAEIERLGLDALSPERDDLLDRARRIDEVVVRAARHAISESDRRLLRIRADMVVARGYGASRVRPFREAGRERLVRALREARQAGDFRSQSHILDALGRSHLRTGSLAEARKSFEESIALKQQLRDLWGLGGALTGIAQCLLAGGLARESLPYFQANLLLLERMAGMEVLFVRNLARHLNALVTAGCNPLETAPPAPEILELAGQLRQEYQTFSPRPDSDPFWLLLEGGYRRLAARRADGFEQAHDHIGRGLESVDRARELFQKSNNAIRLAEADRTLAALLLERVGLARASELCALTARADLDRARVALEEADRDTQGEQARVQAELLWARYHELAGSPYQMQLHLAAARRIAEASGLQALALEVDSRLGVRLAGPAPAVESVVVALPGEVVPLEIRATDWRGRPLPNFVLHAFIETQHGPPPGVLPLHQHTDHLGRARFELTCSQPGRATFHAATPDGVHTATVRVVVRDLRIEWPLDRRAAEALTPGHARLLRQLFGPGCPRLHILREFTTGRTATRVLLVEPFRDGEEGEELRGQPCIVKLGPRALLEDEQARYRQWVKELLPVNVSRLDGFTSWQDEAALRLGLVGDASRGQVREACEWLAGAEAFDAHLLLERVFVGDLAACWYANNPRERGPVPLAELYGPMIPCLLHLDDDSPPRGLSAAQPGDGQTVRVEEGLRPTSARSFRDGEEVVISGASVLDYRIVGERWEYELRTKSAPLRIVFRSSLPPDLIEPDGAPERLFDGRTWTIRGRVRSTAFDRLQAALSRCIAVFNETHRGDSVSLTDDDRFLLFSCERVYRRRSNPLKHLGRLLGHLTTCHWSPIHGDLHGRNILVGPQGQPFYVDFARTGYGPTLFDFIKFEVYLWHENFAGWPSASLPAGVGLTEAIELLDDLASAAPARHFPSPYARRGLDGRPGWPGLFRQCVATLRSAARPYVVDAGGLDYFVPLALYTALMLRWCDPESTTDPAERRILARQGVMHALAAGSLIDGVLATSKRVTQ